MVTREKDRRVSFVQFALHTSRCTLPTNKSLVDQALWHPNVQKSWLRHYFELKSSQYETKSTQIQPSCFFGRRQIPYYHHNWSNQRITTILVGLPFKIVISELQISQLGDFFSSVSNIWQNISSQFAPPRYFSSTNSLGEACSLPDQTPVQEQQSPISDQDDGHHPGVNKKPLTLKRYLKIWTPFRDSMERFPWYRLSDRQFWKFPPVPVLDRQFKNK